MISSAVEEGRLKVLGEFSSSEANVSALHLKTVSKVDVENIINIIKSQF